MQTALVERTDWITRWAILFSAFFVWFGLLQAF